MSPMRPVPVRRRPLLRAAVVGGGAYAAGHAAARSAQRAEREAVQEARISDLEQARQPIAPQPAARAQADPGPDSPVLGQLTELLRMHDAGTLSDAEFSAAKARLLA